MMSVVVVCPGDRRSLTRHPNSIVSTRYCFICELFVNHSDRGATPKSHIESYNQDQRVLTWTDPHILLIHSHF
ncbi:Adenine DNA glycosylase [Dirofilaria immitis]